MGEPWQRPRLLSHLGHLNHEVCYRSPNETLARRATVASRVYRKLGVRRSASGGGGGGGGSGGSSGGGGGGSGGLMEPSRKGGTSWKAWRAVWRNHTELALTLGGLLQADDPAASCDEAERLAAQNSKWWASWWPW